MSPKIRDWPIIFRNQVAAVIAKACGRPGAHRLIQPQRRVIGEGHAVRCGLEQVFGGVGVGVAARAGQVATWIIAESGATRCRQLVQAVGAVSAVHIIVPAPCVAG
jgi:hypothetical protein